MVDADAGAVAQRSPDGAGEGLVAVVPHAVRDRGRKPPVLAVGGEVVRGAPTRASRARRSWSTQASAPPGSTPTARSVTIGATSTRAASWRSASNCSQQWKRDPIGPLGGEAGDGRAVGVPQLGRPVPPGAGVLLGDGAEDGPALEVVAPLRPGTRRARARRRSEVVEERARAPPASPPTPPSGRCAAPPAAPEPARRARRPRSSVGGAGHLLDGEVEGVQVAAAARVVRARLRGGRRARGRAGG